MKLAHTMIRVKDLDQSVAFYTDFLGLQEIRRGTIADECTLVFLADKDQHYSIELTYNHDGRDYALGTQFGHLAFTVSDLTKVIADVQQRGWWYRENPGRYIFVKDPNGYDIEILQSNG